MSYGTDEGLIEIDPPNSKSLPWRALARRIQAHTVSHDPKPSAHCSPITETPLFCDVTRHIARNQVVNGCACDA